MGFSFEGYRPGMVSKGVIKGVIVLILLSSLLHIGFLAYPYGLLHIEKEHRGHNGKQEGTNGKDFGKEAPKTVNYA